MISEQDLKLFFNKIDSVRYLVMRNYTCLLEEINTGGDIDLLIDSVENFIECANAIPLNDGDKCYNYRVEIGETWVPVDIRVVGDNYYDGLWEYDMLSRRVLYQERFYVMDKDDFFYSIVYHSMLHKLEIPKKYIHMFAERNMTTKEELSKSLNEFMKSKGYRYVTPDDKGVQFNSKNFRKLKMANFFRNRRKTG